MTDAGVWHEGYHARTTEFWWRLARFERSGDVVRSEGEDLLSGELIAPASPLWTDVLARADHDFYHLPCYLDLSTDEGQQPFAFLATSGEHRLLLPFIRRPIPVDIGGRTLFDITSPYGYPGPIWTRGAPADFINGALSKFVTTLAAEGVVSSFIRLHTLLNGPSDFAGIGEIVNHGPCVFIDLMSSTEDLWSATRYGHRSEIRKLEKSGYSIIMDDWTHFDDFLKCYYQGMKRIGAGSSYFFSQGYFEKMRECLGECLHLCLVYLEGEIACAALVTEVDGLCQFHLSSTADAHARRNPAKLMVHHLRGWLKSRGNRIFHLGGGVGGTRDSLHLFKAGFSGLSADFCTWRTIPDRTLYNALVARWSVETSRPPVEREQFFPQYRAPREA